MAKSRMNRRSNRRMNRRTKRRQSGGKKVRKTSKKNRTKKVAVSKSSKMNQTISKKEIRKVNKMITAKLKKYKRQKKTRRNTKKSKSNTKGALPMISRIKNFLRAGIWETGGIIPQNELARMTIGGPADQELLRQYENKLEAVLNYEPDYSICDHGPDQVCPNCTQHN